jgi:LPXTG-motif cell wall-anchored protein
MANAKKVGLLATIAAAIGALFFWRKKKKGADVSTGV